MVVSAEVVGVAAPWWSCRRQGASSRGAGRPTWGVCALPQLSKRWSGTARQTRTERSLGLLLDDTLWLPIGTGLETPHPAPIQEDLDEPDATSACPDLTTFCRLDELVLHVVGQRLEPDRAALACRIAEPDQWCRRCGCTANVAVLTEGRRVLIDDAHRFDGGAVIGVNEPRALRSLGGHGSGRCA